MIDKDVRGGTRLNLSVGDGIWVPCRVGNGPFPDERRVSVDIDGNEWFGFVNIRWLRHKVKEGDDEILVKVVDVSENTFTGRMPGNSIERSFFEGQLAKVAPNDNLQTRHSRAS